MHPTDKQYRLAMKYKAGIDCPVCRTGSSYAKHLSVEMLRIRASQCRNNALLQPERLQEPYIREALRYETHADERPSDTP